MLKRTESSERTVHNAGILRGGGEEHHSVERKIWFEIFEMPTLEVTHGNAFTAILGIELMYDILYLIHRYEHATTCQCKFSGE